MTPPALVINAGGASIRMGQPKALLPVPPTGRPLIAHIADRLLPLPPTRVLVIANDLPSTALSALPAETRILPDHYPGIGPLSGIATGLMLCEEWAVVVACDLPLIDVHLIRHLTAYATSTVDAVVPHVNDRFQPLLAVYHRRCLDAIRERIINHDYRARGFLADVRTHTVFADEIVREGFSLDSFVNVNTPQEWEAMRVRLADEPTL